MSEQKHFVQPAQLFRLSDAFPDSKDASQAIVHDSYTAQAPLVFSISGEQQRSPVIETEDIIETANQIRAQGYDVIIVNPAGQEKMRRPCITGKLQRTRRTTRQTLSLVAWQPSKYAWCLSQSIS